MIWLAIILAAVGLDLMAEAVFFSKGLSPRAAKLALGVVLAAAGGALLLAVGS